VKTALENLGLGDAALVSIGVDQTYRNVLTERQAGVTYTNTTGKPILVSISVLNEVNHESSFLLVGGTEVASSAVSPMQNVYPIVRGQLLAIVGKGKTYQLTGTGTIMGWSELR
ncbi:hypothetical protein ACKKKX_004673, partial [Escherichia coli]